MLNKVILIGRLCADPEIRYTQSGVAVATFRLAVNRNYKNQAGEYEADYIPIQAWRGTAEICGKYLKKGKLVAVAGRIQTGSFDGQDGQKRYTWEVVADEIQFLERKDGQAQHIPEGYTPLEDGEKLPF